MAPAIESSTRDERVAYVREHYRCIADCDQCGLCALFHGQDAEHALAAYIDGEMPLAQVLMGYRRR